MAGMKSKRMHLGVLLGLLGAAVWLSRGPEGGETVDKGVKGRFKDEVKEVVRASGDVERNAEVGVVREEIPEVVAFGEWLGRWERAGSGERVGMEAEGVGLARERRRRMADLMVADPERALRLAVRGVRRVGLPERVREMLEEEVNAMGSFSVACARVVPGRELEGGGLLRWAEIGGEVYEVGVYGAGLEYVTKGRVPLRGIALPVEAATNVSENPAVRVDKVMALDSEPAEVIGLEDRGVERELVDGCAIEDAVEVRLGGEVRRFCCAAHGREWAGRAVAAYGLSEPDVPVMASGGVGEVAASGLPVAASGYTEGYKRMLFLRPRFSDSSSALADTISDSRATALMNEFINHMNNLSWGRIRIAPLGPGGSQFTPALVIGRPAGDYDNAGLSRLYPDARAAAAAAGYVLGDFAFAAVFTNGRPAAGYAGLAYVGGVGMHLANGYYGLSVFTHEFGHNLGLPHAHTWDTSDNSIIGDGSNVEYGNNHDPMGSGGDGMHYTSSHKTSIDWIPSSESARVTAAGVYRLHVSDEPRNGNGFRGLRVSRDAGRDYWFDYRATLSGTEFERGLVLHFTNKQGEDSYRVDALPRQTGLTLPVGMTFTDAAAGVSVTPLGTGAAAFPRAMDVAVGFAVSGNRAPEGRLVAQAGHVASGAECVWEVEATDADGDRLAYYWDFGDGTHSWDNGRVQRKTFGGDGEYAVQCVVSDCRGGTWRKTVVQRVGVLPAGQVRISGRVVDGDSQPMGGVRVYTEGNLYAWSDSDGSYALCRVPVGVRRIDAMEVVENRLTFVRTFSSGMNWTVNATGADLSVAETAAETVTALVPRLSVWKYNDTGTDLGTAWRARTFNDAAWAQGPGLLGYGNGGEGTVISFGPDAQNKRTTAYFRRRFSVANPAVFKELRLLCQRDDAVMVYLNGTRIYQDNFAATVTEANITYATTALDSTEPGVYQQTNGISPTLLVAGDNWLCAEVHQVEPTSSDLAFDGELLGVQDAPTAGAQAAYLTFPESGGRVAPGGQVVLKAEARARTAVVTKVEFLIDGVKAGEDLTAPYELTWSNPTAGAHVLRVVATFSVGSPLTSGAVAVTVGAEPAVLIGAGSVWKWRASAAAAPVGWEQPGFDDAGWSSGAAQLGYGDGDEATNISPGGTRYVRAQFRRTFAVADARAVSGLRCRLVRDDAALVYVNGVLAFRHNFRGDGTAQPAGSEENAWVEAMLDAGLLRTGWNTVAVELVQESATSSDASFDMELKADLGTGRGRGVYVAARGAVLLPEVPVLTGEVVPGAGLGVRRVEWLVNGVKVGESGEWPWSVAWSGAVAGSHVVAAVATDSAGAVFSGPVVTLVVRQPAVATVLVKRGEVWKYADRGADPGPNWAGRTSFSDTAWPEGAGRLGYGGDGEVTPLYYDDAGAKPATVYFRKKFTVADPAAFDALRLRVVRDDGVSVQLNRVELLRDNLPEGELSFSTLATASADDEVNPVEVVVPVTGLRAGENQLAVEVHQSAVGSSDLGFDLELAGLKAPAAAGASVWLTAPAAGQVLRSDEPLGFAVATANLPGAVRRVEYFAGSAKLGESVSAPWGLVWGSALKGSYGVRARVELASGASLTTAVVPVTVGSPVTVQRLIWSGADWRFLDSGVTPASGWTGGVFDDAAWKTGRTRLGFGGDGETGQVTPGRTVYWFRRAFAVPAGVVFSAGRLRVMRDDGIQLYLNGNRIWVNNLPDNPGPADLATASVGGADEQTWLTVPLAVSALTAGNNVFAAEIRQNAATSSDVGFDLELEVETVTGGGLVNTAPVVVPRLGLTETGGTGLQLTLPDAAGRIYRIESSVNLGVWGTESTHIMNGNVLTVPLTRAGPGRFYRARWMSSP